MGGKDGVVRALRNTLHRPSLVLFLAVSMCVLRDGSGCPAGLFTVRSEVILYLEMAIFPFMDPRRDIIGKRRVREAFEVGGPG